MMDAERNRSQTQTAAQPSQPESRKVKITFEEYEKLSKLIVSTIKTFERDGHDSIAQHEVVNSLVQRIEIDDGNQTSIEQSVETSKKIQNVIDHLIKKEKVLMIT